MSLRPRTLEQWKDFAGTEALQHIPGKVNRSHGGGSLRHRDVFFDVTDSLEGHDDLAIFVDVLALGKQHCRVPLTDDRIVQLYARVATATGPVHIDVVTPKHHGGGVMGLYFSERDYPITWSFNGEEQTAIGWGEAGLKLVAKKGAVVATPLASYGNLDTHDSELLPSLRTSLRMALVLFWERDVVALSIAAHVARVTDQDSTARLLHAQAAALGQQIASSAVAGKHADFAPVLRITTYLTTLNAAIDAAAAYQLQWDRFNDAEATLKDQTEAWKTMTSHAEGNQSTRETLANMAWQKYRDAQSITENCLALFADDQAELVKCQREFKAGIDDWKAKMEREAIIKILTGLVTFAIAVGAMAMGDEAAAGGAGGAAAEAGKAAQEIEEAEKVASKVGKILQSDTVKKLKQCAEQMQTLLDAVSGIVEGIQELDGPKVSEDRQPAPASDLDSIVSVAAWDKWTLESDEQLQFAVEQNIGGASEYRLALRKHAINGKLLARAQAQTIKSGQEFAHAKVSIKAAAQDVENLRLLLAGFEQRHDEIEAAKSLLYDQLLMVQMSIAIELRNLTLAYKYYTLEDSSITVNLRKKIEAYRTDALTVQEELQNAESRFAGDYQPYKFKVYISDYHVSIIQSLKATNAASFTLSPMVGQHELAGPFTEGSHFRVDGLEVLLVGVKPRPEYVKRGLGTARIRISTSGMYADVRGDDVFHFSSLPLVRRFEYYITAQGDKKNVRIHSSFKNTKHVQPTAFTQWKIKIENPEALVLDDLEDVMLKWTGTASFD